MVDLRSSVEVGYVAEKGADCHETVICKTALIDWTYGGLLYIYGVIYMFAGAFEDSVKGSGRLTCRSVDALSRGGTGTMIYRSA